MIEFFFGTQWHDIGDNISWRTYKHWGPVFTPARAGKSLEKIDQDAEERLEVSGGHRLLS